MPPPAVRAGGGGGVLIGSMLRQEAASDTKGIALPDKRPRFCKALFQNRFAHVFILSRPTFREASARAFCGLTGSPE